ncbi:MAG TPA: serine/threonine-protein kinase, partial [Chthoniobacterales bacterium]
MNPARWQQVKAVLGDALELDETGQRTAFVASACAEDTALMREVNSLLNSSRSDRFEACASDMRVGSSEVDETPIGQRLGAYRIVQELGRGGMGAVYLAERADQEFTKQVAIKLLKRGTDTDEVLRRFRSEREILARLEHPNIARLLDAGTTEDGLPYFVMEYVIGARVNDYCFAQNLSVADRLRLFLKICAAVQFAHQNLVIHRDVKPANILITAEGEPKLLDFGIAKLVSLDGGAFQLTVQDQQRLTPAYASPEQVRGDAITTVSDVYSLGALLYELLVGVSPHKFA